MENPAFILTNIDLVLSFTLFAYRTSKKNNGKDHPIEIHNDLLGVDG